MPNQRTRVNLAPMGATVNGSVLDTDMSELPKSFLFVAAFIVLALGLIVYFVSKQFLFRRHKRKGEEAIQRQDYLAAAESFRRAEALWDFNATKETTPSYLRDLATLDELLNSLEAAARAGGFTLALSEYRDAVKALQAEFQGKGGGKQTHSGKTYASAFMRFKNAQFAMREQLRANRTRRCPAPR